MEKLTLSIEAVLYLPILLTIASKIEECKIVRKPLILADIFISLCFIASSVTINDTFFPLLCFSFPMLHVLLIYFSAPELRLSALFAHFVFVYFSASIFMTLTYGIALNEWRFLMFAELAAHIVITLCIIVFCNIDKFRYKTQQILQNIPKPIKILILSTMIICTLVCAIIIANPQMHGSPRWNIATRIILVFFPIIICIIVPILITSSLTNTYLKKQNEVFERELKAQAEHYIALSESNKELRRFKHDFKNLRIGITQALQSNDNDLALEMIENCQNDFIGSTENIIKFNTGNGIVDAILHEKQKIASEINATITFEGFLPQNIFSPTDLCVIFGNTLDNATEACERLPENQAKTISVSVNCIGGIAFISITNPVSEKIDVINNTVQTTKKNRDKHGFGLYSLEKIAKKYNGKMDIISKDNSFTVIFELYF